MRSQAIMQVHIPRCNIEIVGETKVVWPELMAAVLRQSPMPGICIVSVPDELR